MKRHSKRLGPTGLYAKPGEKHKHKTQIRQQLLYCMEKTIKQNMKQDNQQAMYWMMTLEYGLKTVRAQIDWAQQSIDVLQEHIK